MDRWRPVGSEQTASMEIAKIHAEILAKAMRKAALKLINLPLAGGSYRYNRHDDISSIEPDGPDSCKVSISGDPTIYMVTMPATTLARIVNGERR